MKVLVVDLVGLYLSLLMLIQLSLDHQGMMITESIIQAMFVYIRMIVYLEIGSKQGRT